MSNESSAEGLTLSFTLKSELTFTGPVNRHVFALRCLPPTTGGQEILQADVSTRPFSALSSVTDSFGNRILTGRIDPPHEAFAYTVSGLARTRAGFADRTPPRPYMKYPTKLTAAGPAIRAFLAGVPARESAAATGLALSEAIHAKLAYVPASTDTRTSAEEAMAKGSGVCQDFTHILLACLRERRIPCRYVSGLFTGEGASHAWAELWDGEKWLALDPTNATVPGVTYLRFAQGCDFADCPIDSGVFYGFVSQSIRVTARVEAAGGAAIK